MLPRKHLSLDYEIFELLGEVAVLWKTRFIDI